MTTKKILAFALIAILAVGAASAQLAFGWSGALYAEDEMTWDEQMDQFKNGEGVFTGPFVELGLGKLALGLSMNFSQYTDEFFYFDGTTWYSAGSYEMLDYDVALYAQAHFFRYTSFLDPFLEVGFGMMATDFANSVDDPDEENPLRATSYFEAGAGLGVNVGMLGFFWKINYMFPGEPVTAEYSYTDGTGTTYTNTYELEQFPLSKLKTYIGFKLIL